MARGHVQQRVWIICHYTQAGMWQPSVDYPFPWRTRKAAQSKLDSIGKPKSLNYRIFKYVIGR